MIDLLQLIFGTPFIVRALIAAILIAMIASTSGTFLVFRGLSFMASGVAHAALGGAALGFFLQETGFFPWFDPVLGAVLFAVLVAVMTGYAGESGIAQKMEVAVGVSFALSMSLAVFLMYYIPSDKVLVLWGYLVGDILLLTNQDVVLLVITTTLVVAVILMLNKEFVYVSVDYEGAIAHGMNARAYHYVMLVVSAIAIALATKAVGAILVYAILVAPAAASNELVKSVTGVMVAVFSIALFAQVIGIMISFAIAVSPSAIAGLIAAFSYVVALQVRRIRERARDQKLFEADKEETIPATFEGVVVPDDHSGHNH
ncbi:MAG: metal ABC transporter permease [Candidatus Thorarchaeota archaeon]|nr:MAG: metal ABC transporter permease [Candidatus Thorarchaeota archaeon]